MTNYFGNIVRCATVRGHVGILAINSLSSLTTDLVDVTDDENFHQVLTSKVMISSVETSLNGHMLEAIWILSQYAYCNVQYAYYRNF